MITLLFDLVHNMVRLPWRNMKNINISVLSVFSFAFSHLILNCSTFTQNTCVHSIQRKYWILQRKPLHKIHVCIQFKEKYWILQRKISLYICMTDHQDLFVVTHEYPLVETISSVLDPHKLSFTEIYFTVYSKQGKLLHYTCCSQWFETTPCKMREMIQRIMKKEKLLI